MTETDKKRDDRIYRMRLLGSSPRAIADDLGISVAAVEEALDRTMVKVDNDYRLRAVRLDLERLDAMQVISCKQQRAEQKCPYCPHSTSSGKVHGLA
jgi:DNA-binding CsgD family transcriptional regulator